MNDTSTIVLLASGFFVIATLYSSVGFGGGSSYLALLTLFVTDFLLIKTAALLCNLIVVTSGSYLFIKQGYFDKRKFLPLALCSVPAAFFGATIKLTQSSFFIALGCVLALSGVLLLLQNFIKRGMEPETYHKKFSAPLNILLGSGTGFLSGLVSIGGGIILSPILNLLRWDHAKKIAALASFFILVNSIAGLLGQAVSGNLKVDGKLVPVLLVAVFAGGQLGTRLSLKMIKPAAVRGLTGILVAYIGIKLVLKYTLRIDI
jgi:uncharacterized protein